MSHVITTQHPSSHTGYTVDENGHHVQHLPPLSEALHPDDAAAGASADHLSGQNAHYGAHSANVYDPHHTGTTADGSSAHGHYDQQQSSNFFDPQIMEPPPPADGSQGHHTGLHGNGTTTNGNNGYGSSSAIMTPPPPASSHGYASSPYQSGGSAPLFHRASISGPVMHSHYPPPPGNQSTTHGADVWSSTSATARPHTADGMFAAPMGGGMPGQWASVSEYNRGPRGSVSSMSDAAPTSGSSKVFSYMPSNGDDSSSTAGSQGHQSSGGPRKRPRRRYDEIERLYSCSWPGCQKSYGTLNHLNAHVAMQKHGPKRSPAEFKDMRKAWRKSKREDEQRRQANAAAANEEALTRSKMTFAQPNQPFMTHTNYPVNNFMPPPTSAQNNANALGGANGNGQGQRYHPQSGMYSGYSTVHNGSYAGGAQAQGAGSGGLGAYLMAHRGSI